LRREPTGVFLVVKSLIRLFLAASAFAATSFAGTPAGQTSKQEEKVSERLVFVTGSLIPQRIQLRRIGTATYSPLRIIDRGEIDQTGRQTTAGSLINEPALNAIGH
jgi:hypothetical protein